MQNEKLVFVKASKGGDTLIRVGGDQYEAIKELSNETGQSMKSITDRLLRFALDRVSLEE